MANLKIRNLKIHLSDRAAALDRARYPLTRVRNVDLPSQPPRLIRMLPEDAVVWCYADHLGEPGEWHKFLNHVVKYENRDGVFFICGPFKAFATGA